MINLFLIPLLLAASAARADIIGLVDTDTGLGVDSDLRYMEVFHFIVPPYSESSSLSSSPSAQLTMRIPTDIRLATGIERGAGCSVTVAPTNQAIIVDMKDGGTSIFSTKITIDPGEYNSQDAGTLPVVSDCCILQGSTFTVFIDQVGTPTAGAGLKCWLLGHYE